MSVFTLKYSLYISLFSHPIYHCLYDESYNDIDYIRNHYLDGGIEWIKFNICKYYKHRHELTKDNGEKENEYDEPVMSFYMPKIYTREKNTYSYIRYHTKKEYKIYNPYISILWHKRPGKESTLVRNYIYRMNSFFREKLKTYFGSVFEYQIERHQNMYIPFFYNKYEYMNDSDYPSTKMKLFHTWNVKIYAKRNYVKYHRLTKNWRKHIGKFILLSPRNYFQTTTNGGLLKVYTQNNVSRIIHQHPDKWRLVFIPISMYYEITEVVKGFVLHFELNYSMNERVYMLLTTPMYYPILTQETKVNDFQPNSIFKNYIWKMNNNGYDTYKLPLKQIKKEDPKKYKKNLDMYRRHKVCYRKVIENDYSCINPIFQHIHNHSVIGIVCSSYYEDPNPDIFNDDDKLMFDYIRGVLQRPVICANIKKYFYCKNNDTLHQIKKGLNGKLGQTIDMNKVILYRNMKCLIQTPEQETIERNKPTIENNSIDYTIHYNTNIKNYMDFTYEDSNIQLYYGNNALPNTSCSIIYKEQEMTNYRILRKNMMVTIMFVLCNGLESKQSTRKTINPLQYTYEDYDIVIV